MGMLDHLIETDILDDWGELKSDKEKYVLLSVAEVLNKDIADGARMYIHPGVPSLFIRREAPYYVIADSKRANLRVYGTVCYLDKPIVSEQDSIPLPEFRGCLPVEKEDEFKIISAMRELHHFYSCTKILAMDVALASVGSLPYEDVKQSIENLQMFNVRENTELFEKYNLSIPLLNVEYTKAMLLRDLGEGND